MPLVQRTELLMGNRFDLGVVANSQKEAEQAIEKAIGEIKRIENLVTTFRGGSQTNLINQNAGIEPVEVDEEVYALIERAQRISGLTQGAFDLTYGSLDKSLWNFDQKMTQLPSAEKALKAVGLIDYRNIVLEKGTVFLKEKGMRTKSGIMLGLGETKEEVEQTIRDLHAHGCDVITIGQYLQPTPKHLPVERFVPPAEFAAHKLFAQSIGCKCVESGPLVRSSYHSERHLFDEA